MAKPKTKSTKRKTRRRFPSRKSPVRPTRDVRIPDETEETPERLTYDDLKYLL